MPSHGVQDLISTIDTYLAEQTANQENRHLTRRASFDRGTMFVDWDGSGRPVVSYRYPCYSPPSPSSTIRRRTPPLIVAENNLEVRYQRPSNGREGGMYIQGFDPETQFEYDYNGQVMHIHRYDSRPWSAHSDYYAVDAQQYNSRYPLQIVDRELNPLPPSEKRKREKVVTFVQKVLSKLDRLGLMQHFRKEKRDWGEKGEGGNANPYATDFPELDP